MEIHKWDILHGDVRASNILVSKEKSVYIIDFESAHVGSTAVRESERSDVERVFEKVKNERES